MGRVCQRNILIVLVVCLLSACPLWADEHQTENKPPSETAGNETANPTPTPSTVEEKETNLARDRMLNLFTSLDEQKNKAIVDALSKLDDRFKPEGTDPDEKELEKLTGDILSGMGEVGIQFLAEEVNNNSWLGIKNEKAKAKLVAAAKKARATEPSSQETEPSSPAKPPAAPNETAPTRRPASPIDPAPITARNENFLKILRGLNASDVPDKFEPFAPYKQGDSAFRDGLRQMAQIYAQMHLQQRSVPGRDQIMDPGLLQETTARMRAFRPTPHKPGYPYDVGGAAPERMWEWELSRAMTEAGQPKSGLDTINGGLAESQGWAMPDRKNFKDAHIAGATGIKKDWKFAGVSLEALGVTEALAAKLRKGETLTDNDKKLFQDAMAKWYEHDLVRLRTQEGNPSVDRQLRSPDNQVFKWGKAYSIDVMRTLASQPELRGMLPESIRSEEGLNQLKSAMEQSLAKDLRAGVKNPALESGVGGSNLHTSLAFYALSVMPKGLQQELVPQYQAILEKGGGGENRYQYAPHRQLAINESERGGAGRGVPYQLAKFSNDPSEANTNALLGAVENFLIYSGSLRANVPRSGVHAGTDGIAPYYFHPNLMPAGTAVRDLAEKLKTSGTKEQKERFANLQQEFGKMVASTFDGKHFLSPGNETYQSLGPVFSGALSMAALSRALPSGESEPVAPPKPSPKPEPPGDLGIQQLASAIDRLKMDMKNNEVPKDLDERIKGILDKMDLSQDGMMEKLADQLGLVRDSRYDLILNLVFAHLREKQLAKQGRSLADSGSRAPTPPTPPSPPRTPPVPKGDGEGDSGGKDRRLPTPLPIPPLPAPPLPERPVGSGGGGNRNGRTPQGENGGAKQKNEQAKQEKDENEKQAQKKKDEQNKMAKTNDGKKDDKGGQSSQGGGKGNAQAAAESGPKMPTLATLAPVSTDAIDKLIKAGTEKESKMDFALFGPRTSSPAAGTTAPIAPANVVLPQAQFKTIERRPAQIRSRTTARAPRVRRY